MPIHSERAKDEAIKGSGLSNAGLIIMKFLNQIITISLILLTGIFLICALELKTRWFSSDLIVKARLDNEHDMNFKVTFNSNRPKILTKKTALFFWCCESFSTKKMIPYSGDICQRQTSYSNAYSGKFAFDDGLELNNVQFIGSDDKSVSKRFKFNGILGISPWSECNNTALDENAVINRMRKGYDGFVIDLPNLYFTSKFKYGFSAELQGEFFEIAELKLGNVVFRKIRAKLDLDFYEIKVPVRIRAPLQKRIARIRVSISHSTQKRIFLNDMFNGHYWFKFGNGAKMYLLLHDQISVNAKKPFEVHNEEWISLGRVFLQNFAVSYDLKKRMIYFEHKLFH